MGKNADPKDRVDFDPADRKQFLLNVQRSKDIKRQKALLKKEAEHREERRLRRAQKKEEYQNLADELVERQKNLGISPLPLVMESSSSKIKMVEVDAQHPKEKAKESVIDVSQSAK